MKKSVLSFFTGVGLLDMGFRAAKFDVIWHNEVNPHFITGFKYGHEKLYGLKEKDLNLYEGSIENLSYSQLKSSTPSGLLERHDFGIIGGPPCPDFSNAGKNLGSDGDNGKLTGYFVNIIITLKPNFFVLENVKGLIQKSKHRKYLSGLLEKLSIDYCFDLKVLNSLDFGVPQDRERLFVLGFRKDFLFDKIGENKLLKILKSNIEIIKVLREDQNKSLSTYNWYDWPFNPIYENARKKFNWPQKSLYGSTPILPELIPPKLLVETSVFNKEIENLPNQCDIFKAYSDKFTKIDEGDISGKSFKRLHRYKYSPTAAYGNNEVHLHPYKPRRLSVREVMRIQSVPDAFQLPENMTLSSKFKTISNGVPVTLAHEIAASIFKFIN